MNSVVATAYLLGVSTRRFEKLAESLGVTQLSTASIRRVRPGENIPTDLSTMHLYPVDGAAHRVGADDTAWAYRDAVWSGVIGGMDPDPANAELIRQWCVDYWTALHPHSMGGSYVNFIGAQESAERVRATYRGHYDRLASIKGDYDPDNLFHANQNIPPVPV